MGWSKLKLVKKAYGVFGLTSNEGFDLSAEQIQDGVSSMNAMMASWNIAGLRLGYPPDSEEPEQDSGIPDWANQAVYLNLGIELAASIGREVSPRIASMALKAYQRISTRVNKPRSKMRLSQPAGAGNRVHGDGGSKKFIETLVTTDTEEDIELGDSELDLGPGE